MQVNASTSSVKKGETLQDTMRCIECYCDAIVLRHPEKGSVSQMASYLKKPIINAGDGAGEHPTQALLDLYTILREQGGKIDGLTITMLGDLKYGRTTHSLAMLLCLFNVKLNYVTPKGLEMPQEVKDAVSAQGLATQADFNDLSNVISETDILYVTRVQKERFENLDEYNAVQGSFVVDPEAIKDAMCWFLEYSRVYC